MNVGLLLIFQNYLGRRSDAEMVVEQLHLVDLAEELGYASVWAPEHHFTDYSACPDNIEFLAYAAGRTQRIRLGTGAVIVPWNDPLRVAEKIALLDHLSGGRAMLGLGRGLSRTEYDHFQIDMGTSRERFDEAARMIVDGLEEGFVEGAGPYYPQIRTPIRPRPLQSFGDRLYAVGMSPESVLQAASLGARLMTFSQGPWELYVDGPLASYREAYAKHHGASPPPPPLTGDLMFCHRDPDEARRIGMEYMTNYFLTIVDHYELMAGHFQEVKGYDLYASASELFKEVGLEVAVKAYCEAQTLGTPAEIVELLQHRRGLVGPYELLLISSYGGMPLELAEGSIRLFAEEVLPALTQ